MADGAAYDGVSDQDLLTRHVEGDPDAFGEIVRRHRDRLWAVALRTMGDELLTANDEVAALAATGVPILVTHGAADDAWPPAEQERMAARLGARHVSIPGAVHSPACETPDVFTRVLLGFWAELGTG